MPSDTYSTKDAAELTGASRQAIRVYTSRYKRYFSTEGAPDEPGQQRQFTVADLKLIAYIAQATKDRKLRHAQVLDELAAGALDDYDWQPPQATETPMGDDSAQAGALVPIAQVQALQALLQDAQRRETEALERAAQQEQDLQDRLAELERQLGQAQGELQGYKAAQRKAPAWWVRLFGGRGEE